MVTSMKRALQVSGVPILTLNQRIWQWLKDHQGKTAAEVAAALGETAGNISSCLGKMFDRGMVTRVLEPHKKGTRGVDFFRYSTHPKLKEYELLPITAAGRKRHEELMLKRNAKKAKATAEKNVFSIAGTAHLPPVEPPQPAIQPVTPPTAEEEIELLLHRMSVGHAFKLFKRLREMFVEHKFPA